MSTSSQRIARVALVGANGTLGSVLLSALLAEPSFTVTAIVRESSSFTPPTSSSYPGATLRVSHVDDALSISSLAEALKGHDALIAAFRFKDPSAHLRLVDAAAAAGIRLFVPADFGSIDADNPRARELVPLYRHKMAVRERAQELASSHPAFSWTGIVCGHFVEWGITDGFFHADLNTKKAEVFDGGRHRASATTLTRVAEATVRVLKRFPDEQVRNRTLFIQSFCVDQLQLVEALEKATGGDKWHVTDLDSEAFIAERRERAGAGEPEAVEDMVFVLGTLDADWTSRDDFANALLGFEDEHVDEVVKRVVLGGR